MDELDEPQAASVGEQLRAAREEKGLSLEDIAAQTRIPQRHLESLEVSEWDKLPAPTYTIGFARSYAGAIGLDRAEIAEQLRNEMGGTRVAATTTEVFEPADPARTMPKWLVFGAIAAVILLVLVMSWLRDRSLQDDSPQVAEQAAPEAGTPAPAANAPPALPVAQGPVVLTANDQVWFRVKDGTRTIKEGVLEAGQSFEVPATAKAPTLTTAKAEALRISVGTADAPSIGPPATKLNDISLLAPDLMRGGSGAPVATTPAPAPAPATR